MRRILLLTFAVVFVMFIQTLQAQDRTISGKVTSIEDGSALPGVNVVLKGTTSGAVTDIDGNYSLNVPADASTLVFSFIGLATEEVEIGSRSVIDVQMSSDVTQLTEVVVTGVAVGTSTKKLGFALSKIDEEALEKVPATDPGNALRGKAAGVTIVQPSGNPATSASIRLRGSTNISGSQSPLILVDGIITNGSLNDINMEDVASMEVIKGAAASSIYGSLASNGVIQIITKRGSKKGKPVITLRSEYGQSEIARDYPSATKHAYLLAEDGSFDLGATGEVQYDPDGLVDNAYPRLYDNAKNVFGGRPWFTNSISVANSSSTMNYYASFQNLTQEGIIQEIPNFSRNSARLNIDFTPNDKWKVTNSISYIDTDGTNVDEQGQAPNLFYGVLIYEPYLNLAERDENGDYAVVPEGADEIDIGNFRNPFYQASKMKDTFARRRFLAGTNIEYKPVKWLTLSGSYSLDRTDRRDERIYPKGFNTPQSNSSVNNGSISRTDRVWSTQIASASASASKKFGKLNSALTLKYLYEDRWYESMSASSYDFAANGVVTLNSGRQSTYTINSSTEPEKAENLYAVLDFDWDDKIIANALIRRDGSSMFGEDERYQFYYRGSLAYRITEDFQLDAVNEWKVRASYGTSGLRPYAWAAQYETYSVSSAGISPVVLGNKDLKPSVSKELEVGTDITFLDRFNLSATYADSKTEDDVLYVPLSPVTGYSGQYQNAGSLKSNTIEISLGAELLTNQNKLTWSLNANFDRTRQTITDLERPPFTRSTNTAVNVFRVENGLPYGTIFGNQIVTSVDQLTLDESGFVVNDVNYANDPVTPDQFITNEDGYLVRKDYYNTSMEQAMLMKGEDGISNLTTKIGDTNPDFHVGVANTFGYKGLQLYVLVDWKQGGDIYNYTKQLLYFEDRHRDNQAYGEIGKHRNYSGGSSTLYNGGAPVSHFVEDGSFVKIREVTLSYRLGSGQMGAFGKILNEAKFSLSGRNLFTFTKYTGWDPEVAINENPTNFMIDEFSYPNFRTYTASIQLKF